MAFSAFQFNAFQTNAFQLGVETITDTDLLHKPVNCVLAGSVPIKDRYREYEIPAYRRAEKTTFSSTPARRLKGPPPSSWTKTDSRGYD